MSASGDGTGSAHGFQEFFLVLPRGFPWQFDLYVDCFAVRYTVSENITLAMLTDIHDASVLRKKLADRMVSGHAAVLTQGCDDFVL